MRTMTTPWKIRGGSQCLQFRYPTSSSHTRQQVLQSMKGPTENERTYRGQEVLQRATAEEGMETKRQVKEREERRGKKKVFDLATCFKPW